MSLRINHNVSAINSHRSLQMNDMKLSKSLEKLSSGLKINRAADGPAALVISEQMRSQIGGLDQAISNSETSISMVQTAEGALNEVSTLLTSMRQLAIHAANEGANDEVMLSADQEELLNSIESINRISKNTQFGTKKLLDGSRGANGIATGAGLDFVKASTKTESSDTAGYDISLTQNATKASKNGTAVLEEEVLTAGETMTIIEGGKAATYTTTDLDNARTAAQNLRAAVKRAGLSVDVDLTEANTLSVSHKEYGSKHSFQVSSTTEGILSTVGGETENAVGGLDLRGTINGDSAIGEGQILKGGPGSTIEGLTVRYTGNAGRGDDELDVENGTSVGTVQVSQNSLIFQVGANRDQTVSVSLLNASPDQLARGQGNDSMFSQLSDIDVTSSQGAQDSLGLIDQAIIEVSGTRAELGAFQKNTLESNLSNLRIASENMVAAESSVRDADMAGEMADFTRNQIMLQSANAMLAQSNQIPGIVLRLLE